MKIEKSNLESVFLLTSLTIFKDFGGSYIKIFTDYLYVTNALFVDSLKE